MNRIKLFEAIDLIDRMKPIQDGRRQPDYNTSDIVDIAKRAHIFIFDSLARKVNAGNIFNPATDTPLDLPFPVISFECLPPEQTLFDFPTQENLHVLCLLIEEIAFNEYLFFAFLVSPTDPDILFIEELDDNSGRIMTGVCLEILKNSSIATEKTKIKKRIGRGKHRHIHKINQVIRIYSGNKKTISSEYGGKIDFSHRFEVRGHWRRIAGIGKDRAGIYQISGFTWVNSFVKGPETKPLIKKLRIKKI